MCYVATYKERLNINLTNLLCHCDENMIFKHSCSLIQQSIAQITHFNSILSCLWFDLNSLVLTRKSFIWTINRFFGNHMYWKLIVLNTIYGKQGLCDKDTVALTLYSQWSTRGEGISIAPTVSCLTLICSEWSIYIYIFISKQNNS